MSENEGGNSAQDIVNKVQKKGDTLDPIKRLTGKLRPGEIATAAALTLPLSVENASSKEGIQYLLTYPGYSALVGGLLGAMYWLGRVKEKRGTKAAESLQEEFRDLVGEPVDLVRTRKGRLSRKSKGDVVLRWYGTDGKTEASLKGQGVGNRLEGLVEVAELAGIKSIAMGASSINEFLQDEGGSDSESLSKYGKVVGSAEFLADAKRMPKLVSDTKSDESLLIATIDQAKLLVEKFKGEGDVYKSLAEIVDRAQITNLLAEWETSKAAVAADPEDKAAQENKRDKALVLRNLLGRNIAERVGDDELLSAVDRMGGGRSYSIITVQNGMMEKRNINILTDEAMIDPPRNLFSVIGIPPGEIGLLIRNIFPSKKDSKEKKEDLPVPYNHRELRASIALYELIGRDMDPKDLEKLTEGLDLAMGSNPIAIQDKKETLYKRLMKESPRTTPFLRRRGRGTKKDTATIEYKNKARAKRYIAAGLLTAALGGASWGVGYEARTHNNNIYSEASDAVGPVDIDSPWSEYSRKVDKEIDKKSFFDRVTYDIVDKIQTKHYDIEQATVLAGLESGVPIDVIKQLADSHYSFLVDEDWINKAKRYDVPQELKNKPWESTAEIGDQSLFRNEELYHVTPLSTDSQEGLWYTELFNTVSATNYLPSFPFTDVGLEYSIRHEGNSVTVRVKQDPKDVSEKLLFKVATPYFDNDVIAPIKSGTKIAAARIIDTKNPQLSYPVTVEQDSRTGLYTISMDGKKDMKTALKDFALPQLEYYLAEAPEPIKADGNMEYDISLVEKSGDRQDNPRYGPIGPLSVVKVRTALGLPPDATEADIKRAITSKKYSYTPLEDSKKKSDQKGDGRVGDDVLSDVAAAYAELPSEVCNTANTIGLFATGGEGNIATGFRISGADNFSLSEGGRHLWITLKDGTVRDYTPAGEDKRMPPVSVPKVEENPGKTALENLGTGGEILGAGALGFLIYRRRKDLNRIIERAKKTYMEERIFDPELLPVVSLLLFTDEKTKITEREVSKAVVGRMGEEKASTPESTMRKLLQFYPHGLTEDGWDYLRTKAKNNVDHGDFNPKKVAAYLDRMQRDWGMIHDYFLTEEKDLVKT